MTIPTLVVLSLPSEWFRAFSVHWNEVTKTPQRGFLYKCMFKWSKSTTYPQSSGNKSTLNVTNLETDRLQCKSHDVGTEQAMFGKHRVPHTVLYCHYITRRYMATTTAERENVHQSSQVYFKATDVTTDPLIILSTFESNSVVMHSDYSDYVSIMTTNSHPVRVWLKLNPHLVSVLQ